MKRILLVTLCVAPACGVFRDSERDKRLATYQQNAASYYEGKRYDQAEDQVQRGLELEPANYKLNLILAMLYLQKGQADHGHLEPAKEQFEKTFALRSSSRLDTRSYLGYGLVNQKLATVRRAEASRLRKEASTGLLPREEAGRRLARAGELETMAAAELEEAKRSFERLIAAGDQVRTAHYQMVQVATLMGRTAEAMQHGAQFLDLAQERRAQIELALQRSFNAPAEALMREELKEMKANELEIRGLLANLAFDHGEHRTAVVHLDRILELDPTRSPDYFNRARCHFAMKNMTAARNDLEVFLRQTPLSFESAQVKEANDMLRTIERELKG
jgi:tetratricopeptide (TPR) repeat protein